jgi:ubiquinone/menaquinone biosynthesis C-methylase UbiE
MITRILNSIIKIGHGPDYRQKLMASYAKEKNLDIGFAQKPNKYLKGDIVGLDLKKVKNIKNYYRTVVGDAQNLEKYFKKSEFESITAGSVIEHIHNPVKFLINCNRILRKGGLLIISTGNPYRFQTFLANVFLPRGFATGTSHEGEHLNLFIPRMLNSLARSLGFSLIEIKCATGIPLPLFQQQIVYVYIKSEGYDKFHNSGV